MIRSLHFLSASLFFSSSHDHFARWALGVTFSFALTAENPFQFVTAHAYDQHAVCILILVCLKGALRRKSMFQSSSPGTGPRVSATLCPSSGFHEPSDQLWQGLHPHQLAEQLQKQPLRSRRWAPALHHHSCTPKTRDAYLQLFLCSLDGKLEAYIQSPSSQRMTRTPKKMAQCPLARSLRRWVTSDKAGLLSGLPAEAHLLCAAETLTGTEMGTRSSHICIPNTRLYSESLGSLPQQL